ncbi:MAG: DUF6320 domain-containing protein [Corallococcus sp.]|nr:DUF6320 domain-containing protein [Corallococcus sp.]
MKYCTKCKVNVNKQHDNCPLCGSYLDSHNDNDNFAEYAKHEDCVTHPVIKIENKVNFLKTKFNRITLVLMLLTVILNLLLTPTLNWSAYVVIGCMFVMFCVITPIAEKSKLQHQIKVDVALITLLAVAMELAVLRLGFNWFVVTEVLPWVYVAALVLVDFLILFRRYEDKGLFATLIYCTVFAVLPQITMWIARAVGAVETSPLRLFIIFFASLLNTAIILIVCTRSLKEEMERNLSI